MFAMMGAALVSGAMAFTSCSSDDTVQDTTALNPTYDGESVKTRFAINIPYVEAKKRMIESNTQSGSQPSFLGMEHVRLVPFKEAPAGATELLSLISLGDIGNTEITSSNSSKQYEDVNVPVGTSHFLFYATAPMGTDASGKFAKGILTESFSNPTKASDVSFSLEKAEVTESGNSTQAESLLKVLNAVAQVDGWVDGESVDEGLKELHTAFTGLKAGSANSILATLENLYNMVDIWASESGTSASKTVAEAIRKAITTDGTFTTKSTGSPYELETSLKYPDNINLPDGAVKLSYSEDNKTFSYDSSVGSGSLDVSKICFPASLYYFTNTDIATSASDAVSWPSSTTAWTSVASAPWLVSGNSWGTTVSATTRLIALKNNIQYAVANLALTVKCEDGSLADKENEGVTVKSEGFPVTGVLVGGQPSNVGWNFEPTTDDACDMTVYDKVEGVNAKAGSAEGKNYTLLLPNKGVAAEKAKVNFAVELENNTGVEFAGQDGVVPVGGKFYLVGQLDPTSKTVNGVENPSVFMSDYQTTANVTIKTLANAYNVIPDLRATQLELGLSVDLTWQQGMSFDVEIGGGN